MLGERDPVAGRIRDAFWAYGMSLDDGGDGDMRYSIPDADIIAAVCDLFRKFELDSDGNLKNRAGA